MTLSSHPDPRGIRVGFLTRTAPAAMGRGAVHIHWDDLGGAGWDLVTVHLKSKLLPFPGGRFNPTDEDERARYAAYALYRRAAEAATVRVAATGVLDGHGQDRRLVVLGDLNDTEHAATTQLLYGPPGSQYGTGGFSHPDRGDGQPLWNTNPQARREAPASDHAPRLPPLQLTVSARRAPAHPNDTDGPVDVRIRRCATRQCCAEHVHRYACLGSCTEPTTAVDGVIRKASEARRTLFGTPGYGTNA